MNIITVILLSLLVLVPLIIMLYCIRVTMKTSRLSKEKIAGLTADLEADHQGGTLSGTHNDMQYSITLREKGRNTPPSVEIKVPCRSPGDIKISPEGSFDRLAKGIGLSSEVQTGDRFFDEHCYIVAENPNFARAYLSTSGYRQAVMTIMKRKPSSIQIEQTGLKVVFSSFHWEKKLDTPFVTEILDQLQTLGSEFPDVEQTLYSRAHLPRTAAVGKDLVSKLIAVPLLCIIPGLVLWWVGSRYFTPVRYTVYLAGGKVGLFLMLCYTGFAFNALKGRSSAHREIARTFVLSLIGFTLLMIGLMAVGNGLLDQSPATEHDVLIAGKHVNSGSRGGSSYYVELNHWDRGERGFKIKVKSSFYQTVPRNGWMRLEIKPGYLGYEWINHYEVTSPPSTDSGG